MDRGIALAFVLTIIAGLATGIGSSMAFVMWITSTKVRNLFFIIHHKPQVLHAILFSLALQLSISSERI